MLKKTAYLCFTGRGEYAEFFGVYPTRAALLEAWDRRNAGDPHIESRTVSQRELEDIKDDEVSAAEWDSYS